MWKAPANAGDDLRIFNSITKEKNKFVTRKGNVVDWYVCGPTVYDAAHMGHARTYVTFDILRRVLEQHFGYDVAYVMNITDIDDKIIARALESGAGDLESACRALTQRYEREFFDDMEKLGVQRPTLVTRVTDYVGEVRQFVADLEKKGFAYEANGSVYFDLAKYKNAWGGPVFVGEDAIDASISDSEKKNKTDFVVWKRSKANEPRYASKWGDGRPGWHVECSVMAMDALGNLDIHSGGVDLAFPHHENEIALSQAHSGAAQWANYFLHAGHLHIAGCKMSKSLKNFITIKEILREATPRELRMLFLQHAWDADMAYTPESIVHARSVEQKLMNFVSFSEGRARDSGNAFLGAKDAFLRLSQAKSAVHAALCNNFDTPTCVRVLADLVAAVYKNIDAMGAEALFSTGAYVKKTCAMFGLAPDAAASGSDAAIADLVCRFRKDVRQFAREKRPHGDLFKICDDARADLATLGFLIEDCGTDSAVRKKI